MERDESQKFLKGGHRAGTTTRLNRTFDSDGLMPLKELGVGTQGKKTNKGRVAARGGVVKDDSGLGCGDH